MRNPWRMQDGPDNKINRNNFPMSFQYNGTFKYGKIYPIGLIRTIPGASYQIDSTLALNFMPTSFPIQTRQRAYVHFFYGRDRNFWKDYKDFVNGMNPDLVKPYLDESVTQARTGNLLDYLGVPTTLVGNYGSYSEISLQPNFVYKKPYSTTSVIGTNFDNMQLYGNTAFSIPSDSDDSADGWIFTYSDFDLPNFRLNELRLRLTLTDTLPNNAQIDDYLNQTSQYSGTLKRKDCISILLFRSADDFIRIYPKYDSSDNGLLIFDLSEYNSTEFISGKVFMTCYTYYPEDDSNNKWTSIQSSIVSSGKASISRLPYYFAPLSLEFQSISNGSIRDIDDTTSPYWRSGATTDLRSRIKLNAIPCRMYETIYNLYYRNPQNNPYILNGKPEYNVFIPTKDGGVDNNLYELRYRNWEDDFLTTAVQTPQQGIAPLVGLTDRGATVTLTNEDGSVTRYKTNLDDNGNVTGIETTDSSEPLLTQALLDAVSYGISIEDLRNVNAMQKWLELNLRKGYQYKDIIEARWGISISYNELDLPEFIGGFTQEVGLQAVTQTTSHGDDITGALGWQAGRMYASGEGRSITHYCEEEGYIMALLTVVPVPNYSQLLPKHWFTRDLLDSYQPEFNHIGFQPITYKEVCPIQAYQESTENVDILEQTFGYQRPWYEYFNQVDEVHGQFRTTFKDFLINRTFDVKPELSESFLLVDPDQINDVFAVTSDDDKIIGAINHRIVAKLPISLYAQARLE